MKDKQEESPRQQPFTQLPNSFSFNFHSLNQFNHPHFYVSKEKFADWFRSEK